ncbi:MAG: helix-turn-helix transcriptional regulator [Thermoleophilia bacterium]
MKKNGDNVSRLLADPTRLEIYRAVTDSGGRSLTAAEVADRFDLHVNVARMHLEKLSAAGLLKSSFRKHSAGGRPPREYSLGNRQFSFQYPPRDYKLLADISLEALESGRKPAVVAREFGRQLGEKALSDSGLKPGDASDSRLIASLRRIVDEQGLLARITEPKPSYLEVQAFNCIFRELSSTHSKLVCEIHRQFFIGICESHLGKVKVTSRMQIAEGGQRCRFTACRR